MISPHPGAMQGPPSHESCHLISIKKVLITLAIPRVLRSSVPETKKTKYIFLITPQYHSRVPGSVHFEMEGLGAQAGPFGHNKMFQVFWKNACACICIHVGACGYVCACVCGGRGCMCVMEGSQQRHRGIMDQPLGLFCCSPIHIC